MCFRLTYLKVRTAFHCHYSAQYFWVCPHQLCTFRDRKSFLTNFLCEIAEVQPDCIEGIYEHTFEAQSESNECLTIVCEVLRKFDIIRLKIYVNVKYYTLS